MITVQPALQMIVPILTTRLASFQSPTCPSLAKVLRIAGNWLDADIGNRNRSQLVCAHFQREISMRSKILLSTLVGSVLAASTIMASAQSQPAPGASSEGTVRPGTNDNGPIEGGK
jgi:hypothetical protein